MTTLGYTLSSEESPPRRLVDLARKAEVTGFDFLTISDHFHPWTTDQGHSPFVWSVLGGVAEVTERVRVGTGVTCPILRIHPAIVAHAAATTALLFEGRFFLGLGSGEALNEHVLGDAWPAIEVRQAMLEEAIEVMRELWTGDVVDHRGQHYTVENAQLFDVPEQPIDLVVSAFGPKAARVAADARAGIWMTGPLDDAVQAYEDAGGRGPRFGQLTICWAEDVDTAVATARAVWPNSAIPGQLSQDLPTPAHFEQAATLVRPEDLRSQIICGPDPGPVLAAIRSYEDAGLDHIHLHQVGPDQEGFFRFWERDVSPKL